MIAKVRGRASYKQEMALLTWIRWFQHLAEHCREREMKRAPPGAEMCQVSSEHI